jgi:hypothetical protein
MIVESESRRAASGSLEIRSMVPVQDLFEGHLSVADVDRAIPFYRDAVGVRLAHIESRRTPPRLCALLTPSEHDSPTCQSRRSL